MTAEFAVVLPAVVLVLAACLGAIRIAVEQVRVTDAAALAARSLGRGDDPAAAAGAASRVSGARVAGVEHDGDVVCVTAAESVPLAGPVGRVPVSARACALTALVP